MIRISVAAAERTAKGSEHSLDPQAHTYVSKVLIEPGADLTGLTGRVHAILTSTSFADKWVV
jgi:hypothetical protein